MATSTMAASAMATSTAATSTAAKKKTTHNDSSSTDDLDSPPDVRVEVGHAAQPLAAARPLAGTAGTKQEALRTLDQKRALSRAGCLIVGFVLFGALTLALVLGTIVMLQSESSTRPLPSTADDVSNMTHGDNDTSGSAETKAADSRLYAPEMQNAMYDYTFLRELESAVADGEQSSDLFCGTHLCLNLASFLERQLDDAKDPCQNLYDHVCSSWQAEHVDMATARNGVYSVDDALLEEYEKRIGQALLDNTIPSQRSRARFLYGCIAGNLTSSDGLVKDVLSKLEAVRDAASVEPLAETIFQMARIGVSPLFDLSISVDNETANVRLLPLVPRNADTFTQTSGDNGRGTETAAHNNQKGEFLKLLRRHVCREAEKTLNKPCRWTLASNVSTPWNYEWLKSNGSMLLTAAAASTLKPFWSSPNQKDSKNGSETSAFSNFTALSKTERLRECLKFMNRYDADTLATLGMNIVPASFKDKALELLQSLKTSLDAATAHDFNVSVALGPLSALEKSSNKNHALSPVAEDSFLNASRLERFMRDSTWKRWLGHFDRNTSTLDSTLTLSIGSSTVAVPLPVFDAFAHKDQSLHKLSLARVGPRVLRTFLRQELAKHLSTSRIEQCVSRLSGSKLLADHDAPDIEEIAAFYVSFQAYRRDVGEGVAIPGSSLDSDALFLYNYVFNECEAQSKSTQIRQQLPSSARRRHVASVAKAFGSFVLGKCQPMPRSGGCDMDNERLLYGNDTGDS